MPASYFQDDGYIEMDIAAPSPMLPALPDSPSPTGFNEAIMSQSMWTEEIEYVDLEKGDRGLGFSILDYKVSFMYQINKVKHSTILFRGMQMFVQLCHFRTLGNSMHP